MGKTVSDPVAELREATAEAHGVMKDLRRLLREIRAAEAEVVELLATTFEAEVGEVVKKGLDQYASEIKEHTDRASDAVLERFDQMASILIGETAKELQSDATLEEIAFAVAGVRAYHDTKRANGGDALYNVTLPEPFERKVKR